jgi:hypothetical protein
MNFAGTASKNVAESGHHPALRKQIEADADQTECPDFIAAAQPFM